MNSVRDAVQTSIISYLKRNNFPLTREAYLGVAFGDPNYGPDAEQELDLPDQFRVLIPPTPG